MNYSEMTVAQLKELLMERDIGYPKNCKKADLIELLEAEEPIEVQAEVIGGDRVQLVPATIDAKAYLEGKRGWIAKMMEPYEGMDEKAIAKMDAQEAKACRADLNRIIKEVEDERKRIKAAYNEPLNKFEKAVKELLEPARADVAMLKEYIDANTEARREMIRQGLESTYEDFAPALVDVVPFERILETNPKWLNPSYGAGKAAQELEDTVAKVAKDWDVLKRQKSLMRFYEESEAVFFRTLDLSAAIAHNDMREKEQQRIDVMKAEVKANQAAQIEEPQQRQRKRYVFSALLSDMELACLREWKNSMGIGEGWTFKGEIND